MKITSVSYRESIMSERFGQRVVEAVSEVTHAEEPEHVLSELRTWVGYRVRESDEALQLAIDHDALKDEVRHLQGKRDQLKAECERRQELVDSLGPIISWPRRVPTVSEVERIKRAVKSVQDNDDEIPF